MHFSVVTIMRNEEKTLPRLAASLSEFLEKGGEWISLDTGSTDKSREVAESLGAHVVAVDDKFLEVIDDELARKINVQFVEGDETPVVKGGDKLFNFAAARNYAASLAKNDVIAMPDCDEAYAKFDLDAISAAIADGVEQMEYDFIYSFDKNGNPAIQFKHCKFYDRRKLQWVGVVHEVLSGSANRNYFPPNIIKLEHHQNQETNRSGYLKGLALDCYQNPTNDRNSHYLGREMFWTGRYRSAIKELTRHIAMNGWEAERSKSYVLIGEAKLALGDFDGAVEAWHKAIQVHANRREPFIRLAEEYAKRGDAMRTVIYATAAMQIAPNGFYADDLTHYRHVPHDLLSWAKETLGDKEGAEKERRASESWTLSKVSFLIPQLGREEGLKRCIESIENLDYPKHLMEILVEEGDATVPVKVEAMRKRATGDVFCYAANDMEFDPMAIREAVRAMRAEKKGLVALHHGFVGYDDGNICEHFIISRELTDRIGGIFDTEFHHVGVDNLLWNVCKKLDEATHCEKAKFTHHHYSLGGKMDAVYRKGWEFAEKDRKLLKLKLAVI